MFLRLGTVKTLFRTEMRMVLRDRRMIVTSIVLPLLVMPLMFFGSSWSIKRHQRQLQLMEIKYAVAGTGADQVRALLDATRARLASSPPPSNAPPFRCTELRSPDTVASLNSGQVHLILEWQDASMAPRTQNVARASDKADPQAKTKTAERIDDEGSEKPVGGAPLVAITFRADNHESATAMSRLREQLQQTRALRRSELLQTRGFPVKKSEVAAVIEVDLASKRQVAGLALGRTLTVLLLLLVLTSGAVVATDSLAGEKERGTLETLLTTSAGRLEILTAKHLVIVAVALVITSIQLGNLVLYVGLKLLPVASNWAAAITPLTVLLLFLLYVPVAALAANLLLLVSGYARTYKEAQMYFLPVLLIGLVPALAPMLPGIPLRSVIVLVPVANIAVAAREILIGSLDWPMIFMSWLVTVLATVWSARVGLRVLLHEKLVTGGDSEAAELAGGQALFEKRVLRWFAVLWAALLILSSYTENLDLRLQVSINLLGLFLGASLLMARHYRLNLRHAFSLRLPKPAVWLGVLAGVPGGFLTALAAFQVANRFIPAPADIVETFTGALFPAHIPFYQVLFFLTVLPGICEELTFRGVLLHGLRRRMHPALAVLAVGLVFGIFHVALFRLVPTAVLGILFGGVTLLTGSILPAMLWHCLNNALGLLVYKFRFPENGLDAPCYLAGAGLLAIAFWIFWRNRVKPDSGEWE
jgi:sodium transport system permease protein